MDQQAIADELFGLLNTGGFTTPFSSRVDGFDIMTGYAVAALVNEKRQATGDTVVGRKIGFTNRTIWPRYNVTGPMWNYVWTSTLFDLATTPVLPVGHLSEPRIEPEIVFGLKRSPEPGMSLGETAQCIEWVSHGFEIVQSVFPGWKFASGDCTAAFGLHGALLVGPRHELDDVDRWVEQLGSFRLQLFKNGQKADDGVAANILDGPLQALGFLVDVIAQNGAPPLEPGEVITTGTITDAHPVIAGDSWSTQIEGIGLEGATITFA